MSVKYGITVFKILKNLLKTLIGENLLNPFLQIQKNDLLNESLLDIFQNYIPNKKINCDYLQPPLITDSIKRSLKKRSKLTKCYYKNRQKKSDYEKLEILEDKNNYIFKITTKLQDPKTAEKTYWDILCRLLYKKKIPAIAP